MSFDSQQHQASNSGQMSSAQSYALGLNPYTNQYSGIPSSVAMGAGGLAAQSYMSPAQYSQYGQQHLNQYAAAQNSPYMQSPTAGYWSQSNTGGSGTAKVQQFSSQPAEKK